MKKCECGSVTEAECTCEFLPDDCRHEYESDGGPCTKCGEQGGLLRTADGVKPRMLTPEEIQALPEGSQMEKGTRLWYGVHIGHCCIEHGCKYGDEDCPVETGLAAQVSTCYYCYEYGIKSMAMLKDVIDKKQPTCRYCGHIVDQEPVAPAVAPVKGLPSDKDIWNALTEVMRDSGGCSSPSLPGLIRMLNTRGIMI